MSECTCGRRFLDAEDYRDHLPCEGTPALRAQLASARSAALEEAAKECLRYGASLDDRIGLYRVRALREGAIECARRIRALKERP